MERTYAQLIIMIMTDANKLKLIKKAGSVVGSHEVAEQRMLARLHIPSPP